MSVPFCDATSIKQDIKHKQKSFKFLVYVISALFLWGGFFSYAQAATYFIAVISFNAYQFGYTIPVENRPVLQYDGTLHGRTAALNTILNGGSIEAGIAEKDPTYCNYRVNYSNPDFQPTPYYKWHCGIDYYITYSTESIQCSGNEPYAVWVDSRNLGCSNDPPPSEPTQPAPEKNLGGCPPKSSGPSPYIAK